VFLLGRCAGVLPNGIAGDKLMNAIASAGLFGHIERSVDASLSVSVPGWSPELSKLVTAHVV
jgi:hypothetical protein